MHFESEERVNISSTVSKRNIITKGLLLGLESTLVRLVLLNGY